MAWLVCLMHYTFTDLHLGLSLNEQLLVNALKSYPWFLSVPESFLVPNPVPVVMVLRRRISIVRHNVSPIFALTPLSWLIVVTGSMRLTSAYCNSLGFLIRMKVQPSSQYTSSRSALFLLLVVSRWYQPAVVAPARYTSEQSLGTIHIWLPHFVMTWGLWILLSYFGTFHSQQTSYVICPLSGGALCDSENSKTISLSIIWPTPLSILRYCPRV